MPYATASYKGKLYNGFPMDSINAQGCPQDSVSQPKMASLRAAS